MQNTNMFWRVQNINMLRVAQNINQDTSFTEAQTYHFLSKSISNKNEEEAKIYFFVTQNIYQIYYVFYRAWSYVRQC